MQLHIFKLDFNLLYFFKFELDAGFCVQELVCFVQIKVKVNLIIYSK